MSKLIYITITLIALSTTKQLKAETVEDMMINEEEKTDVGQKDSENVKEPADVLSNDSIESEAKSTSDISNNEESRVERSSNILLTDNVETDDQLQTTDYADSLLKTDDFPEENKSSRDEFDDGAKSSQDEVDDRGVVDAQISSTKNLYGMNVEEKKSEDKAESEDELIEKIDIDEEQRNADTDGDDASESSSSLLGTRRMMQDVIIDSKSRSIDKSVMGSNRNVKNNENLKYFGETNFPNGYEYMYPHLYQNVPGFLYNSRVQTMPAQNVPPLYISRLTSQELVNQPGRYQNPLAQNLNNQIYDSSEMFSSDFKLIDDFKDMTNAYPYIPPLTSSKIGTTPSPIPLSYRNYNYNYPNSPKNNYNSQSSLSGYDAYNKLRDTTHYMSLANTNTYNSDNIRQYAEKIKKIFDQNYPIYSNYPYEYNRGKRYARFKILISS